MNEFIQSMTDKSLRGYGLSRIPIKVIRDLDRSGEIWAMPKNRNSSYLATREEATAWNETIGLKVTGNKRYEKIAEFDDITEISTDVFQLAYPGFVVGRIDFLFNIAKRATHDNT